MSSRSRDRDANPLRPSQAPEASMTGTPRAGTARSVCKLFAVVFFCLTAVSAAVPDDTRQVIDRLIGVKGTYAADEGVHKFVLPRAEATIVLDYQRLSPNLGLNSWAAFASGVHHEAILTGQFLVLDDEVNPVLGALLTAGLDVTGLAATPYGHLHTMDVNGLGSFSTLASAFRKGLDEIERMRRTAAVSRKKFEVPNLPLDSSIDPSPLDTALSMNGTVSEGVYKAAIGRRTLLNGELVGREMGMSTWISIAGNNDHAVAHGEFIESVDGLRKLLSALRNRGFNIASICIHTVGEHPQCVFVNFWGEGSAIQLARAMRYALDVQVGAIQPRSGEKI